MAWAAVFPGQGSQHSGMGKFLYEEFKEAKWTFEEASDALSLDMKTLCFSAAESDLALTMNTQPALLTVSVATYRTLAKTFGFNPVVSAGHSVGEFAAVVTSGGMGFADALRAVRFRGERMQEAVPVGVGAMVAVLGSSVEQVHQLCEWVKEVCPEGLVEPANYNAPGQIVLSGKKIALDWLQNHYSDCPEMPTRIKFIPLKVSAPFHCSLMKSAEESLGKLLKTMSFYDISRAVVQNYNAKPVKEGEVLRQNLISQVSAPVRWIECVQEIKQISGTHFVEVGCGKILAGLVKKIDSNIVTYGTNHLEDLKILEKLFTQKDLLQ
ncbi:MAG: ACP S-malonyltransferase [Bdellovibrionales bacterium]|nr:ACP S-malonyltransferase [Bdellovibrionales bacterium]